MTITAVSIPSTLERGSGNPGVVLPTGRKRLELRLRAQGLEVEDCLTCDGYAYTTTVTVIARDGAQSRRTLRYCAGNGNHGHKCPPQIVKEEPIDMEASIAQKPARTCADCGTSIDARGGRKVCTDCRKRRDHEAKYAEGLAEFPEPHPCLCGCGATAKAGRKFASPGCGGRAHLRREVIAPAEPEQTAGPTPGGFVDRLVLAVRALRGFSDEELDLVLAVARADRSAS